MLQASENKINKLYFHDLMQKQVNNLGLINILGIGNNYRRQIVI